ncbi:MAG TPA: hypothetical protein VM008_18190 [Phycisphaerae bacterium]|nr:hypothetical protein [Phycisphaerae bacterium]
MKKEWKSLGLLLAGVLAVGLMAGCEGTEKKESETKEGAETKVAFSSLPAAVQATLTKEANGAEVKEADMEMKDGVKVYEADVMIGGKNMEVVVAENGTVVSRKEENEEGEKKEADEKDEKGEKKD